MARVEVPGTFVFESDRLVFFFSKDDPNAFVDLSEHKQHEAFKSILGSGVTHFLQSQTSEQQTEEPSGADGMLKTQIDKAMAGMQEAEKAMFQQAEKAESTLNELRAQMQNEQGNATG